MAKGRWLDREILEVVSTEFRDRSVEYYVRDRFLLLLLSVVRVQDVESTCSFFFSLEIRSGIWSYDCERPDCETRYDHS
jgi:hypothetical protein